jgi:hypothetical protein
MKVFNIIARTFILIVLLVFMIDRGNAQEMPPKPVSVSLVQSLSFGAFLQSVGGGSVIVEASGIRTSMGDIILVNNGYLYFPAIFRLEGNPGTVVHFLAGPAANIMGNHGGQMTMTLGDSDPASPFILSSSSPNGTLMIYIGGVLEVGNPLANPPGSYSGSFYVMFIQE